MKKASTLTFTFVNPNSPAAFEAALKKILLEKLLAEYTYPETGSTPYQKGGN